MLSNSQCIGQAETTNKIIMNGIEKRLKKSKDKWVEELLSISWAYQITLRKATNETSYSLTFDFNVVISLELGLPTI